MYRARRIIAISLVVMLVSLSLTAQTQRRRRPSPTASRTAPPASRTASPVSSILTGVYRLDISRSDDPQDAAERATGNLPAGERQRVVDSLTARLTSPDQLSLERQGQTVSIASTRAPRVTFEADGRERVERAPDGHTIRTRAVLYGDSLMVSTSGSRDDEFTVNFDPVDNGRGLRVTRRINDSQINRPALVQSIYQKVSNTARWSVYGEPEQSRTTTARNVQRTNPRIAQANPSRNRPPGSPPVIRQSAPPAQPSPRTNDGPNNTGFQIGNGTQFVAVLDDHLSTATSRQGDRFTLTVREPSFFTGARIDGHIASISRSGRVSGRSEMTFSFDRITLPDGRSAPFNGFVEEVRPVNGEEVRVDNESGGQVQESNNQSDRTIERTAIGAAVGAVIGAIAGGGKGAAIGAAIGAGAGAGSVYAQGRDDLELTRGAQLIIRSTAPR